MKFELPVSYSSSHWLSILHMVKYVFTRTSLVAQMVKHLPIMQETRVQSLGREDLLEKEMAAHCSILAWKIPWTEEPRGATVHGVAELDTTQQLHFHFTKVCFSATLPIHLTLSFPSCVHKFVPCVCISIGALQTGSSVPSF